MDEYRRYLERSIAAEYQLQAIMMLGTVKSLFHIIEHLPEHLNEEHEDGTATS